MISQVPAVNMPAYTKIVNVKVVSQHPSQNFNNQTLLGLKDIPLKTIKAYNVQIAFTNGNVISTNALKVDIDSIDKIGNNGLNLKKIFNDNETTLTKAVNRIYRDRNVPGKSLKWIDLPAKQLEYVNPETGMTKADEILNHIDTKVRGKFDDALIIGIGGSSLGSKALINTLQNSQWNELSSEERKGLPKVHFVENVDPDSFSELMNEFDKKRLEKTLVVVISKSGLTTEPTINYLNIFEKLENALGKDNVKNNVVTITDPRKGDLREQANEKDFKTFEVPSDVGGRYSVFSDVGLYPAALAGIDIKELLKGAKEMSEICEKTDDLMNNPAANQALIHKQLYDKKKNISVIMPASQKMALIGDWYCQLWAESLGKKFTEDNKEVHINHTPLTAVLSVDLHSKQQLFDESGQQMVFTLIGPKQFKNNVPITNDPTLIPDSFDYLRGKSFNDVFSAIRQGEKKALINKNRPVIDIEMPTLNAHSLGQLMQMFMIQTALVGELQGLGTNTFSQPGVEDYKNETSSLLGKEQK